MTEITNTLVDAIQPVLHAAVQDRQLVLWGSVSLTVVAATLLLLVVATIWRLRELARMRERMSRLADGLALLTDTTEAGLTTISRQIEQLAKKPAAAPRPSSRMNVAKRVVAAAMQGDEVTNIARSEALSESEVRLHLALAERGSRKKLEVRS